MPDKAGMSPGGASPRGLTDGRSDRQRISEIQRARMLSAMTDVVAERGARNVTVAHVIARSGVSRRTFYEIFRDREDCFLQAFSDGVSRIAREVAPAYEWEQRWRDAVRSALAVVLGLVEDEPAVGRLVIVEVLGAGPEALERRRHVVESLVRIVDRGRRETKTGHEPPALTAEGVVGAVLSVLHARLSAQQSQGLMDLLNPLMSIIVFPYLGRHMADKELNGPAPLREPNGLKGRPDPLRDLEMRLTYRTVRVLMSVAASPGASNRTVANGAGIADQGQISKLLTRLQRLGLIENTGRGSTRGEPNVWTLTAKGWEVQSVIAPRRERSKLAQQADDVHH
jgi:AcrR family transcriptional regulator